MLQTGGHKVFLGGNIGVPPLDLLRQGINSEDYVVLELANFQLIDLQHSPHIAVCLLVEPEHLDWHTDVDEYYEAKTHLFRHQTSEDIAIYYAENDNSKRIASTGPGKLIPYFEQPGAAVAGNHITIDGRPIIRLSELKLIGKHNYQNVCAAVTAVWQVMPDLEPITETLREFSGLAFRLELIRKVNDISYFDDSFGSAPTATIAAIEAIEGNKVLIIGGKDRGLDLTELAETIQRNQENITKVILIGQSRERIGQELNKAGFSNYDLCESKEMTKIVELAASIANPNDSVILSPGFPSFDMFKNFEDRGVQFNEAVNSL
jgi:UDP-N-acetylmuramoylalanine--D-glutamate ligase